MFGLFRDRTHLSHTRGALLGKPSVPPLEPLSRGRSDALVGSVNFAGVRRDPLRKDYRRVQIQRFT